jgi:hypothetical protein
MGKRFSPSVYCHWNGSAGSIYGFLEELDRRKIRADQDYECARFIQLVGEFFDQNQISGLSLGVANGPTSDKPEDLQKVQTDHGDNGFYLVDRMHRVEGRPHVRRLKEQWVTGAEARDPGFCEAHAEALEKALYYESTDVYCLLRELSPDEVERERKEAETHEYREQFREFYAELTKGKEIKGY